MSSKDTKSLDAVELSHLAIKAMQAGEDDRAIGLLERAIAADPKDARPHIVLSGIQASRQQMDTAIATMQRALELDPQQDGARFQLGMMHFTSGKAFEAEVVWSPLDRLDEKHPLRLFKAGMLKLAKDDFEGCVRTLEAGIANCQVASLVKEMRRVIGKVEALLGK